MKEKIELVKRWIVSGDKDLGTAELVLCILPDYYETIIAYHCRQAVEKYLKALIFYMDFNLRKTHNFLYLLDLVSVKIKIDNSFYNEIINVN